VNSEGAGWRHTGSQGSPEGTLTLHSPFTQTLAVPLRHDLPWLAGTQPLEGSQVLHGPQVAELQVVRAAASAAQMHAPSCQARTRNVILRATLPVLARYELILRTLPSCQLVHSCILSLERFLTRIDAHSGAY
jgi:hypothetical protein